MNWDELEQGEHKAMLQWYRDLIGLRHSIPGFGRDPANIEFDEEARWLVMTHSGLAVVCNLGDDSQDVPFRHPDYHMIMASRGDCTVTDGRVHIPGITVAVFAAQAVRNTMPEVAELPAASNPVVATLKSLWDRLGTGVKKKK